ncbi:thioesterase II family protein [Herbaspirillum seropedicae]|uniref:thioesterase II family protein n=1 Tax=Herbaspirillum seropedicae TaxID=964 RepID=UPI003F8D09CE
MMAPTWLLFCLPCAGGSASSYLRWRRLLPAHIQVLPLELPGRGSRMAETALRDFDTLSMQLTGRVAAELARWPQARYALFGHSMGALLAYGMARRLALQSALRQPDALLLSASAAPSRRDTHRFAASDTASLLHDLRRLGGTDPEVFEDRELLSMTLDVLAADYAVCASFIRHPGPPLTMPLQVYAGRSDEIDAVCLNAWREETRAAFDLHWFDGGHFYLHAQQDALLAHLAARLDGLCAPSCQEASHAA